ncbi:type I-E CRISPR-associated protein Cas7/Cse4/CasC [Frankia sp. AiPa1]|uniref:type I-E CRISPR-associated protein Cas7/Cse4/CasC n=1 Tax=Frankia sp. AiPa1 TaxID=573492 RepID=UPI00202AD7B8|nr:type I-E CRISPR-associated protein Cas7/Cse4/CasC [Frankia sp. AiPa1]MCL9760950.1 type I-E CRISPR-associated protein Cas7/Cse4/CasC [Frankia sp. AiPa1]
MFLDLHILQTVPPSNLNRDETGTPKWATYGGVRRARVSSQAWKRATRIHFIREIPHTDLAIRTRELVDVFTAGLTGAGVAADIADGAARLVVAALGLKTKKATRPDRREAQDTEFAMFLGQRHIDRIVELVAAGLTATAKPNAKKVVEAAEPLAVVSGAQPIDVALFGRMVADVTRLHVDAACQVAHALSTHDVDTEFDYFTTVDEVKEARGEAGAAMIGTVEFNSAVLYRYASVNLPSLATNLGGDEQRAAEAATAFADAFIRSMPSGKQNTFGNRTLPEVIVLTARADQPLNLVGAFEEPVVSDGGFLAPSFQHLAEHAAAMYKMYDADPASTAAVYTPRLGTLPQVSDVFGAATPLPEALATMRSRLATLLTDAGTPGHAGSSSGFGSHGGSGSGSGGGANAGSAW